MPNIGWGSRDIVPPRPAIVMGQMYVRVAREALDPLTVTAMAVEGRRSDGSPDGAIVASLDVTLITDALQDAVRRLVAQRVPELRPEKVFLAATHSHTSPVIGEGFYPHPGEGVMTPGECESFIAQRTAEAAVEAWQSRGPCSIGRAYGHAVVAHNRRPVYADGTAQMYGAASRPDFRWIEGPEDHSLDMLFVWDAQGELRGLVLDVPCPSQVDEHLEQWSADYWHETRVELRARLGERLRVLPLCGASGDVSPHFIFDAKQEEEMRRRRGVTERQEIALRLADAVQRALACTGPMQGEPIVAHEMRRIELPPRRISEQERDWHQAQHERAVRQMDPGLWWPTGLRRVVEEFEGVRTAAPVPVEVHALRLGDAVVVTNPFELYTDYGYRIKARSAAGQTLVVQLAAGAGWYLPTQRAVDGGGYGAVAVVSKVGPEGGQQLVEETLAAMAGLFGGDG